MKKVILTLAVIAGTISLAIAGTPKSDAKANTEVVASPAETKTADATAYFEYIGPQPPASGDLTNPSNYGNTQVDQEDICNSGSLGCAAEFTISGSGHTGAPLDVRTKNN